MSSEDTNDVRSEGAEASGGVSPTPECLLDEEETNHMKSFVEEYDKSWDEFKEHIVKLFEAAVNESMEILADQLLKMALSRLAAPPILKEKFKIDPRMIPTVVLVNAQKKA